MILVVHPGSGSGLFSHHGSSDLKGTGSRIRIRNNEITNTFSKLVLV